MAVAVAVDVAVALAVAVTVAVAVAVAVAVGVRVAVGVADGFGVRVEVGDGVGVGVRGLADRAGASLDSSVPFTLATCEKDFSWITRSAAAQMSTPDRSGMRKCRARMCVPLEIKSGGLTKATEEDFFFISRGGVDLG